MFVHWRGSPLPLALFPPPSITPRTAAMPRSPFRRARFLVSFAVWLWMSKPSSPAPLAVLRFRRLWSSFALTRKPSPRLPLTRFPRTMLWAPPMKGCGIPRRMPARRA